MTIRHPRPDVTHYLPYFLFAVFFIAVNGTVLTSRFAVAENTGVNPFHCIVVQTPALRTKLFIALVMIAAIQLQDCVKS